MLELAWKKILNRPRLSLLLIPAGLLWLISLIYGVGSFFGRLWMLAPVKLKLPVISVGNLSVGGTGKTPLVMLMADRLISEGIRVGIAASGYGRELSHFVIGSGYKISEMTHDEVGDEVLFLAGQLPRAHFAIDKTKRIAAANLALSGEVDIILVDDGFQHRGLHRDLNVVAYDASIPARLLKRFPYGVLREPLTALKRADIVIITRSNFALDLGLLKARLQKINPNAALYAAQFVARSLVGRKREQPVKYLQDKSLFLFAGIGNFRHFRKHVAALCNDIDETMELEDHQSYDRNLLEKIKQRAADCGSDMILTTGKDWVKLGDFDFGREIYYLDLAIDLDPGEEKLTEVFLSLPEIEREKV